MKRMSILLLLAVFVIPLNGQAQLLKKMKDKAEKAAERTILNRTDRETSKTTDKGIDEVLKGDKNKKKDNKKKESKTVIGSSGTENQDNNGPSEEMSKDFEEKMGSLFSGGGSSQLANVPDTYKFSYRAKMQIKTGNKEEMLVDYYLEPDVTYFGSGFNENGATSVNVMDVEQNTLVIFMEQNGQKFMMSQKSDPKLTEKFDKANEDIDKEYMANLKDIGGRTILGYNCKGYETSTKEGTYRMWITNETPVGFLGAGMNEDIDLPESMMKMGKNAMVMEMQFAPVKGKKGRLHMLCIDFKKENKIIKKSEYRSMMGF